MEKLIYIVGLGPGDEEYLSGQAREALEASDVIVGYKVYVDLVKDYYPDKEYMTTGMRQEIERCRLCYDLAKEGKKVSLVCSGDAGIYGMANHDCCLISLSDLLTPWETIEKRLRAAVAGDFAIAIYNPASHKRPDHLKKACDILIDAGAGKDRACGYVENIGRENTSSYVCTLEELRDRQVNMFTTVFIGNSLSYIYGDKLITKRGYK